MDTFLFPADGRSVILPILGAVVALALAAIPRPRWMNAREAKKRKAQRLTLVGIGVLMVPAAFLSPSSTFTKLTIEGDALLLHYDLSRRRDTIPMAELRGLEWEWERKRGGQSGSILRIYTRRGDSYASTPIPMLDARVMEPRLAARVLITPEPETQTPMPSIFFHPADDSAAAGQ